MIAMSDFLDAVRRNADRVTDYQLGHDGTGGECDCIGLAIGAVRLAGGKYSGTHGSNWAARHEVAGLCPVTSAAQLRPGQLILKAKRPGEAGWALPDKYRNDPDQNDYYHAGVVLSASPLLIVHCTTRTEGGGIYYDTKMGNWAYAADLKQVDYTGSAPDQEEEQRMKATIWTENGKPANLRGRKSTSSALIGQIPVSDGIEVVEEDGDWAKVIWGTKTGYVLSKFVNYPPVGEGDDQESTGETVSIELPYDLAIRLRDQLNLQLGLG